MSLKLNHKIHYNFMIVAGVMAMTGGTAHANPLYTFSPAINGQTDVSIASAPTEDATSSATARTIIFAGGNGQYFITLPSRKHPAADASRSTPQASASDKRNP